ncbi:hypothetical protein BASA83_009514 [Batrachochytrium salamandrivorans]|nr:hypothetical protein BASA83_009514 [Batrachochytrium salamandrivorans]
MPCLAALPVEVMTMIIHELTFADAMALRQTSHSIYARVYAAAPNRLLHFTDVAGLHTAIQCRQVPFLHPRQLLQHCADSLSINGNIRARGYNSRRSVDGSSINKNSINTNSVRTHHRYDGCCDASLNKHNSSSVSTTAMPPLSVSIDTSASTHEPASKFAIKPRAHRSLIDGCLITVGCRGRMLLRLCPAESLGAYLSFNNTMNHAMVHHHIPTLRITLKTTIKVLMDIKSAIQRISHDGCRLYSAVAADSHQSKMIRLGSSADSAVCLPNIPNTQADSITRFFTPCRFSTILKHNGNLSNTNTPKRVSPDNIREHLLSGYMLRRLADRHLSISDPESSETNSIIRNTYNRPTLPWPDPAHWQSYTIIDPMTMSNTSHGIVSQRASDSSLVEYVASEASPLSVKLDCAYVNEISDSILAYQHRITSKWILM